MRGVRWSVPISADLLSMAHAYWEAGLTPMPRVSGHVEPSYVDQDGVIHSIPWGDYKGQQPAWATVAAWCAHSDWATGGVLLLTGVSPHPGYQHPVLQILDVESAVMWDAFQEACNYAGLADVLYRCVIEQTPSHGMHAGFLCTAIGERQKQTLARARAGHKVLIELLQHQPCTVAPTQIRCKPEHPAGVLYMLVQGDWAQPLVISPEQRRQLLEVAASFNEVPARIIHPAGTGTPGTRPCDVLGARVDPAWWQDLLTRHGWRDVSRAGLARQGITYWQRPDKTGRQPSATLGACGPYFYVFTSNGAPFEPDRAYSPFAVYALLEPGGNFAQAAKAVVQQLGLAPRLAPPAGRRLSPGLSVRLLHPLTMSRNGSKASQGSPAGDPDGTRLFFWDGAHRVELPAVPPTRAGHLVKVFTNDLMLTMGRIKFEDVRDRHHLALHAALESEADQKAWLLRFVEVAALLQEDSTAAEVRQPDVRKLADVAVERVEWLWKPLLPVGRPVSLEGNPGVGKSNVVMKLAAHLTTGRPCPTVLDAPAPQKALPPCTVCLPGVEDDAADTIRPRLEVNGGDTARVYLLEGWRHPDGSRGRVTLQDLRLLETMLTAYQPALLVVDPLQAFFGRGLDMNHANETRPVLQDVADLCKEQRCTILYVRQLAKSHKEQAIYAAIGSIDISAHVRSAMRVGVDPDNPVRRILAHHKASNAPEAESLPFTLTSVEREMFRADGSSVMVEASRVDWGALSPLTAADLLQPRTRDDEQEEKSALEQAREFLQELLQQGPVLAKEVHAAIFQRLKPTVLR